MRRSDDEILERVLLDGLTPTGVLWSIFLALVSRVRAPLARTPSGGSNSVETFYRNARGREEEYEIVDLSRGPYRQLLANLTRCVPVYLHSSAKILDLGCGDLHLLHHLERSAALPFSYWGVDILAPSTKARRLLGSSYGFETLDLETTAFTPPFVPNLIFSSNALCYVRQHDAVLKRAAQLVEKDGFVVLIEPLPSLFWETYFSGVHLTLRRRGALRPIMEGAGMTYVGDHLLYAFRVANWWFWPVSYLTIFRK